MTDGCSHYENKCEIWTPCCDRYYRCFRCHDENSSSCGKPLDRSNIDRIRCLHCKLEQGPSKDCKGCHVSFAEYICLECSVYRQSHPDGIYHCPHCKVCRVGKGLDISHWHCHSCCLCLSIEAVNKEEHAKVCKIDARSLECAICFENLHDSQDPLVAGHSCGHYLHQTCWEAYNNTMGKIACPICQQPFVEIDEWKLMQNAFIKIAVPLGVLFVAIASVTNTKREAGVLTTSVALAIVGIRRHGLTLGLLVGYIFIQAVEMGFMSTALTVFLPIAVENILQRFPALHLPWVGRCLKLVGFLAIVILITETDPETTQ